PQASGSASAGSIELRGEVSMTRNVPPRWMPVGVATAVTQTWSPETETEEGAAPVPIVRIGCIDPLNCQREESVSLAAHTSAPGAAATWGFCPAVVVVVTTPDPVLASDTVPSEPFATKI